VVQDFSIANKIDLKSFKLSNKSGYVNQEILPV